MTTTPTLLNLDELALLRGWLHGLPTDVLADLCDGELPRAVLQRCRNKLILKARRIGMDWEEGWLANKPGGIATVLKRLDILQHAEDIVPETSQPLRYWLADTLLDKIAALGISTVMEWAEVYHTRTGKPWWTEIEGLGVVAAQEIEQALLAIFPTLLADTCPVSPLVVHQTAVVPLGQFLLPEELSGTEGSNRSPNKPFIPAQDDHQAISCWLERFDAASHTRRSYQREAERLLLWAILAKQKALSSLDMVDMKEYRDFLADPQPASLWVGKPQKQGHPHWKPFTGPLSLKSRRLSETILSGLFSFLVAQHYLLHNPLQALPKLKSPTGASAIGIHRSFTAQEWQLISTAIDRQIPTQMGPDRQKWLRTRLILQLGYGTGLRLHELTNATLGGIEARQRQGQTQYWLEILGKGQKLRQVPLPPPLYALMSVTYRQLTGHAITRPTPDSPLIPPLRGSETKPLTPHAIHKIVKEAFTLAAATLADEHPETAAKLALASTHWLRHTHGSVAVDNHIPLTMVRDNLGHSNIATTSQYVHADSDARHEAFVERFLVPS